MAAMVTWADLNNLATTDWWKEAEWRAEAERFVAEVDVDRDGKVWLKEIAQSELGVEAGEEAVVRAFNTLDSEKHRGWLDPSQCTAFFFLFAHNRRACRFCHKLLLPGAAFTCSACLPIAANNSPPFCLCSSCLSSPESFEADEEDSESSAPNAAAAARHSRHPHHHHHHNNNVSFNSTSSSISSISRPHPHPRNLFLHDLLLFRKLLSQPPAAATPAVAGADGDQPPYKVVDQTIKQCCICGDFHEPNIKGLMGPFHMAKKKDSPHEYVCEWCFSYFCSKCGDRIRDSTSRAEPGKWLQKYMCPKCHTNMATVDRYDIFLQRLRHDLSTSELLSNCKTCEIKHRQGILMASALTSGTVQQSRAPQPSRNMSVNQAANLMSSGHGAQHQLAAAASRGPAATNNMGLGPRINVSPFAHVGLQAARNISDHHELNNNAMNHPNRPFPQPAASQFNNLQLGPR